MTIWVRISPMLPYVIAVAALGALGYAVTWLTLPQEHRSRNLRDHLLFFAFAGVLTLSTAAYGIQGFAEHRRHEEERLVAKAKAVQDAKDALTLLPSIEAIDSYVTTGISCQDYTDKMREAEAAMDVFGRAHPNNRHLQELKDAVDPYVVAKKVWQYNVDRDHFGVVWESFSFDLERLGLKIDERRHYVDSNTRDYLWTMGKESLPALRVRLTQTVGQG